MTTLNLIVGASGDDGYWQAPSTYSATATVNVFGNSSGSVSNWLRFLSVTIPNAATITSAVLTFTAASNLSANTDNCRIVAFDEDNSAQPTNYANVNGRAQTSAHVDWSAIGAWTSASTYNSPDIKSVIQAIVNRAGWSSGNALAIAVIDNSSSANAYRFANAYDTSTTTCAKLAITYTSSVTTNQSLSVTSTGTASVAKGVGHVLAVTSTGTATLVRSVGKKIAATSTGTATLVKSVGKVLSGAATATASLLTPRIVARVLSAVSTATASLSLSSVFARTLSAISTAIATILRAPTVAPKSGTVGVTFSAATVGSTISATQMGVTFTAPVVGNTFTSGTMGNSETPARMGATIT